MTDTSPKHNRQDPGYSQQDWDEVSDTPELTEAEAAELRPARDVPEVYALLPKRGRGRPKIPDAKVNLTLRVDPALLEAYKASGPGWQVKMQEALAFFLTAEAMPKPKVVRRSVLYGTVATKSSGSFKGVGVERTATSGRYVTKEENGKPSVSKPRPKTA